MIRGSRQFWHHRRAQRLLPRVRSRVRVHGEPRFSSVVAYKAGMSTITMIDDSESPSKQQEVSRACTILELPTMEVYGIRFYVRNKFNNYLESSGELYSKSIAGKIGIKKIKSDESKLEAMKAKLPEFADISALIVAYPKTTSTYQNHVEKFESQIDAKDIQSKFEFVSKVLGKELPVESAFKTGEFIDVSSITQGKGWAGVIKRYGVARLNPKATQKTRHVGTLGPFTPGKVLYTVPQAGQMGFNYRTERNKRILKIGTKDQVKEVNQSAGMANYGNLINSFVVIEGSIPGGANRLVRLREGASSMNRKGIKAPKIISINTN